MELKAEALGSQHRASVVVPSEHLTAAELISSIGVEPDELWTRGEPRTRTLPRNIDGSLGEVLYRSDLPSHVHVGDHVEQLLFRLKPAADRIGEISRTARPAAEPGSWPPQRAYLKLDCLFRADSDSLYIVPK